MNHADILICSAVGLLGAGLYARGRRPLLRLQRGIVLMRAAGFQARECWEGGKARLSRWRECCERAARGQ